MLGIYKNNFDRRG